MAQQWQKHDQYKTDPKSPDNVHEDHPDTTGDGKSTSGDAQTQVPDGNPGNPTQDKWKEIDDEKVMTTKEEMPSPESPK